MCTHLLLPCCLLQEYAGVCCSCPSADPPMGWHLYGSLVRVGQEYAPRAGTMARHHGPAPWTNTMADGK